eukprot:jgi/Ulvmu1/7427/UM036_0088.1
MLFDRLIRRIGRTARGSAAKKHQVVYYDIRINNVESAWSAVRVVWISGTGKQTRSDAVPIVDACAQLDGGVTVEHTLYKAQREFLPKTVHIAIDAQPAGAFADAAAATAPFVRLASLYLDIGTMCNGSYKGIVVTDARPSRPGAASGKVYQVQMRIEVPGLAAEKMAGARGAGGLDQLTTVSSYQDSLMFTSAPADLAHGPDGGKGPELEAVHLESMSNLSEGHMPRAHGHERSAGDSTGDLALAHYDERQGQSSMLSENTEAAQPRLERRASAHSSLTSEDLDDYDPTDPAADDRSKGASGASQGVSPNSQATASTSPAAVHSSPKPGALHGSPGPRVATALPGMHASASEALEPVVEDPLDTARAAPSEADAARDGLSDVVAGTPPTGVQEPPAGGAAEEERAAEERGGEGRVAKERSTEDWQEGAQSASIQLEDEAGGAASSSLEDSRSVPLAARHGRRGGTAAASGPLARQPGQQRSVGHRGKGGEADSRSAGPPGEDRRAPGSLRKPTAASTAARRTAAQPAAATPKPRTAHPSAATYRSRPSPSSSASSTPARSTPPSRTSSAPTSTRHSFPMQTPRPPVREKAPVWTPASASRARRRTAALRASMEDAARPSPARKAPLDTGLPLKQKMIVRRDPLLYRKGQVAAAPAGGGQGLGERREHRQQTTPSGRDYPSSTLAPSSSSRSEAAFELALDVHKHKAPGGAAAAAAQPRWVSKATVARRQQRQQQTEQRKSIAPGTSAFGTSVPALRASALPRRPGDPIASSSAGSGASSTTRKTAAAHKSPPSTKTLAPHASTSPPPQPSTTASPGSPPAKPLAPVAASAASPTMSPRPPTSRSRSPTKSMSPGPQSPAKASSRSASSSPVRSPTKSASPSKSASPAKSPSKSPAAATAAQQRTPAHAAAEGVVSRGGTPGKPAAHAVSCSPVQIGSRAQLSMAAGDGVAEVGSRDSPTCRTEVSSLSAVPQTLGTGQSGASPTRSQAGVSELSIDDGDAASTVDIAAELTVTANTAAAPVGPAQLGGADMHGLPERQSASTFIKELSSHITSLSGIVASRGGIDAQAHAAGDADRPNGAANGRAGNSLEPGGGTSRLSSVSHASGGPLSALDAIESGSSSISMSCQMGPTASRASSDYAATEYAATGPFVDSIVDGQVLGWMNATQTSYYQAE